MSTLKDKTIFITGASRGIGLAIARRAARDGANIIVAAKTAAVHKKLPGTIYTAAAEIEKAGGRALPIVMDVRFEESVVAAVRAGVAAFGGIDILVNNASAINLANSENIDLHRFDLIHSVNVRGTFVASRACLPYLKRATNPHVLTLSPPLRMRAEWFAAHLPYTLSKYGMSMCVLGMAEEYRTQGIAFNALWPRTMIATSAVEHMLGGRGAMRRSRTPEIMADAAHIILTRTAREFTGRFVFDDETLADAGISDLKSYSVQPGEQLRPDLFVDEFVAGPVAETRDISGQAWSEI